MQDCLTSVHADIARLALVGKYFSQPILNLVYANYTEVSVESSENAKHFLLFYYYGGMIAASVKNYSRYVYEVKWLFRLVPAKYQSQSIPFGYTI